MSLQRLIVRSATYHWRTNLAVALGVAAAVAVLGGALLVGDSVRGSLRDLALSRLGRTGQVVSSLGYFRDGLAADLSANGARGAAPLIATRGFITHERSQRRAAGVLVYGIDERFWRFHGLEPREGVFISPALRDELAVAAGDVLLTRLQKPTEIPLESLFAHKEDLGRTVRLTVADALAPGELGEFSLQPQQAEVRAVFAPLSRLQRDLATPRQVNTILIDDATTEADAARAIRSAVTLADLGIEVGVVADGAAVVVESGGGVIGEGLEQAARDVARELGETPVPVFTYLANSIRVAGREVPYSLVSGIALHALPTPGPPGAASASSARPADKPPPPSSDIGAPPQTLGAEAIVLNDWAARELNARVGDTAEVDFYLWDPAAGLRTDSARFRVAAIVPMTGVAADRRLAPVYPGITDSDSLAGWDPPFPLDLARVRPQDETYWRDHRTTPKAFIAYERARELWATRYGALTSLRFPVAAGRNAESLAGSLRTRLLAGVTPASQGLIVTPARRLALASSTGATDFGQYFTYFSFFIVVSALLLVVLFFRLGIEQRLRQIGVFRATGYARRDLQRMLISEAGLIALAGGLAGIAGAVGYAALVVHGLRTWWVGAVGTTLLELHVSGVSLAIGFAGGMIAALACVLVSLRAVFRRTPRALLGAHSIDEPAGADPARSRRSARLGVVLVVAALSLLTLGVLAPAAQAGAFFGASAALLTACLFFLSSWLRTPDPKVLGGHGRWAVSRLGMRGAAFRPARSVLSAALIASATFIIVSVDAFRRDGGELTGNVQSGTGGYALLAHSEVPIVHHPDTAEGREALIVQSPDFARARFTRFRLRPGEDVSCLNLYRPGNPAIIAPEASFIAARRFTFSASLAETEQERANPWLLLERSFPDGSVPVIADATSLQYVLHLGVGDTMTIENGGTRPVTLRFVGALRDSVLQGELVMGGQQFVRLFPGEEGYRFFLIEAPDVRTPDDARRLAETIEKDLQPFGVDAISTVERLEAFHRVENTYLSTFQALGALGLLLGTIGLATVMFRNVLERRRELALLRAVGYDARHVTLMVGAETVFLLVAGLAAGAGCAIVAIAPAWLARAGSGPGAGLLLLLGAVLVAGLLSAAIATRAAVRGPLLEALRAE